MKLRLNSPSHLHAFFGSLALGLSLLGHQPASGQDDEISGAAAAAAIERQLVAAIAKAERSVVAISRVRKGTIADPSDPRFVPTEFGSGVIIDDQGHILTNYHVLGEPDENDYFVWVQRRPFQVIDVLKAEKVRAADPWTDLAILKIEADDLEPIQFGDGDSLRKGQLVISLGNPYAIARDGEASASWGIVSNLSRKLTNHPSHPDNDAAEDGSLHHFGTLIHVDTRLELGTSGGALINLKGEMVGLTSSLAAMDQFDTTAGFAIPVDATFRRTVEKLKKGELVEYGFLGVSPRDLNATDRRDGGSGVSVAQVVEGTPAEVAGIRFGDLITHINAVPIRDSAEFMRELGKLPVGANVVVSISRKRIGVEELQKLQLPITLSKKYVNSTLSAYSENQLPSWRGMVIDYATAIPEFAERSRYVDQDGCIAVVSVERGSPAWNSGLRPRDFITHVNGERISMPAQFHEAIAELEGDSTEVVISHAPRGQSTHKQVPAR